MRSYLITLATALSLVGFVAVSAAGTGGGGSSAGGASAGAGSGGGGSGHGGGGGGGGAHGGGGGHGGGGYHGGSHAGGSYVGHGSYTREGDHGSYRVVGYESAGLGRSGAAPRDGHVARDTFVIGPRTGSAAAARRVTDRHVIPSLPHKPKPAICYAAGGADTCPATGEPQEFAMPAAFCPPDADTNGYRLPGCPGSKKSTAR
jgi:hypothetical protein